MAFVFFAFLRVAFSFLIVLFPLGGFLASVFLDSIDYYFFRLVSPEDYLFYQNWDKLLDLLFLSVAFALSLRWGNRLARWGSIVLFFLRLLGVVIFLVFGEREIFFFFPNIFEFYYLIYLGSLKIFKTDLIASRRDLFVLFLAAALPKLIQEYFLHFSQAPFWQWFW
jgi:hypothetical protein